MAIDHVRRVIGETPLPTSWLAALSFCPFCSGRGFFDDDTLDEQRPCLRCDGTGDLFGTLLREAYKAGRGEVLHKLGGVREMVGVAIEQSEGPIDTAQLRRRLGV